MEQASILIRQPQALPLGDHHPDNRSHRIVLLYDFLPGACVHLNNKFLLPRGPSPFNKHVGAGGIAGGIREQVDNCSDDFLSIAHSP